MIRNLLVILLAIAAILISGAAVEAQSDSAPDQPDTTQSEGSESGNGVDASSSAAQSERAPGTFPRSPTGFYRGNSPRNPGDAGFYLNLWAFVPVLGLFFLWTWSSYWVSEDSRALKVRPEFWNSIVLVCGFVGFWAALGLASFSLGFGALLLFYAVPLGLYIKERNDKVPQSSKVMTPEHIKGVLNRYLAQYGIEFGSSEGSTPTYGPPIRFVGKSSTGEGYDENRSRQVENSHGYLAAKELVYDAIQQRGTDVHLEPKEDQVAVRLRIDGVMQAGEPFDKAVGESVVNIFKVLSAMDITERRRAQDGGFRAELDGRDIDFRVATQGTRYGEKMSLRILDQSTSVSTLPQLGLRKQLMEQLREIIHQPHGLFLCCGPTGAGKSTTLYASLNEIDSYQRNIITVEDPIEYKIENVNQIEINTKAGQTFANSLRSILRQDPDVVMIGEIRDGETATIACQAANTGHMVFSTVHANDTITALFRLMELGVEPYMVADSLSAILGQRLARRLCPDCREAYKPNPSFLKKAGIPPEKVKQFYRPPKNPQIVCPTCGGLGFRGRVGVYELLVITDRLRDLIREKAAVSSIKAEARKSGMLYMKEEGLRLVVRGITSVDELLRVVK